MVGGGGREKREERGEKDEKITKLGKWWEEGEWRARVRMGVVGCISSHLYSSDDTSLPQTHLLSSKGGGGRQQGVIPYLNSWGCDLT